MKIKKEDLERAILGMGKEPLNPIGQCFDSAAFQFIHQSCNPPNTVMCHGIGVANMPGEEGAIIGHAWLEAPHSSGIRIAMDTTWGVMAPADHYREGLQLKKVVEYSFNEFYKLWNEKNISGPFDEEIIKVVYKGEIL